MSDRFVCMTLLNKVNYSTIIAALSGQQK